MIPKTMAGEVEAAIEVVCKLGRRATPASRAALRREALVQVKAYLVDLEIQLPHLSIGELDEDLHRDFTTILMAVQEAEHRADDLLAAATTEERSASADVPAKRRRRGDAPTLQNIAERIHVHLQAMEKDPKANVQHHGTSTFFWANAHAAGARVGVKYVSYHPTTYLTKAQAAYYLARLDGGYRDTHFELKDEKGWPAA